MPYQLDNELDKLGVLMQRAQQGDNAAYARLLEQITSLLRSYLLKKLNQIEEVEDVLQEILISIHQARHTYNVSRPFKPWMYSIAKFRLYDHLRKVYRKQRDDQAIMDEYQENDDNDVTEEDSRIELIEEMLHDLPEKQRNIITLMKVEGFTAKEVGEKLGMSESAVKVSAHRTYKKLKETFDKQSKTDEN